MIEQLIAAGHEIVAAGLVRGWGGNVSGRFQNKIVITRTGADLGALTPEDFAWVDPADGQALSIGPRPSSELAMHLAVYAADAAVQVVVHAHPPQGIALGLLGRPLPALTPDGYLHLGAEVPLLPYVTPTTAELATAVAAHLPHAPAILLQNHGVLVTGSTVAYALLRLMLLEEQAGIYLRTLAIGEPRVLSTEDMARLDAVTGGRYRR